MAVAAITPTGLMKGNVVSNSRERGAAAVEFALLMPLLIMLVLGIMEFGRAYNVQQSLSNAAREGARAMAINNDAAAARLAARTAAGSLASLQNFNVQIVASDGSSSCSATKQVTVTVTYSLATITGIAGPFDMSGKGTMLCGG